MPQQPVPIPHGYVNQRDAAKIVNVTVKRLQVFVRLGRIPVAGHVVRGVFRHPYYDPKVIRAFAAIPRKSGSPKRKVTS